MNNQFPDYPISQFPNSAVGLYASLLGASWLELAAPVRLIHSPHSTIRARGELRIVRGHSLAARVLASLMRLPRPSPAARTRLVVTERGGHEHWHRTFDDRRLDSRQYATGDREFGERVGTLEFRFRVEPCEGALVFRQVGLAIMFGPIRVPVPNALAPQVSAREDPVAARQVRVGVAVALPVFGPLVSYDGVIHVEEDHA